MKMDKYDFYKNSVLNFIKKELELDAPEIILNSMKYSVYSGGKRLRAVIAISVYEALGGDFNNILPFASAIELIHTYSLIHDDLPAMDNDDLRRGLPTNHIKFGENFAILAGDGLLNLAFEIMLKYSHDINHINAMKEIAVSSGVTGMIGGQVVDIELENGIKDVASLEYIHKNKTGKLLKASFLVGPILSQRQDLFNDITELGFDYGLAFQILDDILDVESTTEILGKPIGSDVNNNKLTYVYYHGLDKAKKDYITLSNKILENSNKIFGKDTFIYNLINESLKRKNWGETWIIFRIF